MYNAHHIAWGFALHQHIAYNALVAGIVVYKAVGNGV